MAVDVIFVQHPRAWRTEFQSWEGIVGRHIRKITDTTHAISRVEVPHPGGPPRGRSGFNYSTGVLQAGIRPSYGFTTGGGDVEGRVIAIPDHALMVHEGTRPHVILPKKPGGKLKFFWHKVGHVVRLDIVHHPGAPAIPYLWNALQKAMARWL